MDNRKISGKLVGKSRDADLKKNDEDTTDSRKSSEDIVGKVNIQMEKQLLPLGNHNLRAMASP